MKLTIDNLDGRGPQDYTQFIDNERPPHLIRRLNKPAELQLSLLAIGPEFVVPANRGRVMVGRANGQDFFTGYVIAVPSYEFLGWGQEDAAFRYKVVACSDEVVLDRKVIRRRFPFVVRSAGNALRQLTEDLLPGAFDTTQVEDLDTILSYACDGQKTWTEHAAELALQARASYRAINGALFFQPLGATSYELSESNPHFCPDMLQLVSTDKLVNDVTVIGLVEPQAHVKDYFVGDGYSLKFYLSQVPFMSASRVLLDEEYAALDPTHWCVIDPRSAISVSGGKLMIAGGTGNDGETALQFAEQIELGGAIFLQHGDVTFDSASTGVLGGLYSGQIASSSCVAGFSISQAGSQSKIQAIVSGSLTGPIVTTQSGHRYVFTTRLLGSEVYRREQSYHSSAHTVGSARGGAAIAGDVRVVMEVHDIDPANPATLIAPSTVLYDGVISDGPGFCTYALINAKSMFCEFSYSRITKAIDAEVRSALPGQNYRTRLTGALADGAECNLHKEPSLQFYPQTMPAPNELISVHYRGAGRALARISNPDNIAAIAGNGDDGVRAAVKKIQSPTARTANDCEQAALAILDDASPSVFTGTYQVWSDFLPGGASDVFPGDGLDVDVPSRNAAFRGIVQQVDVVFEDLDGEHSQYKLAFTSDGNEALAMELGAGIVSDAIDLAAVPLAKVGLEFLADVTGAEITQTSSTSVTIDAGQDSPSGGGFEVRWSDSNWGETSDRNLAGRFASRTFTLPRLGRVEDYYVRQYDGSSPAKYSRFSAALHLDYPL